MNASDHTTPRPRRLCRAAALAALALALLPAVSASGEDGHFSWMLPGERISEEMAAPAIAAAGQGRSEEAFDAIAWRFLDERDGGIANPRAELAISKRSADEMGHRHLRFRHYYQGVRVGDTELIVHITASGAVFGHNGFLEPDHSALRARARRHLSDGGLRLNSREALDAIKADMGLAKVVVAALEPRIDTRYDTVYWLARVSPEHLPQTTIYHIADKEDAEILFSRLEIRSFLPLYEQSAE